MGKCVSERDAQKAYAHVRVFVVQYVYRAEQLPHGLFQDGATGKKVPSSAVRKLCEVERFPSPPKPLAGGESNARSDQSEFPPV